MIMCKARMWWRLKTEAKRGFRNEIQDGECLQIFRSPVALTSLRPPTHAQGEGSALITSLYHVFILLVCTLSSIKSQSVWQLSFHPPVLRRRHPQHFTQPISPTRKLSKRGPLSEGWPRQFAFLDGRPCWLACGLISILLHNSKIRISYLYKLILVYIDTDIDLKLK